MKIRVLMRPSNIGKTVTIKTIEKHFVFNN